MRSRRSVWWPICAALILTLLVGCWSFRVRNASPAHLQEPLNYSRNDVFDAVLGEAHKMNLEVKVLEKASGLLRFETIRLSPTQMDQYCQYPLESTGCRQLPTSLSGAADANESGWGVLSITVLVTSTGADSSMVDIRAIGETAITVRSVTHALSVESTGVLERELLDGVKQRLGT